MESTWQQHPDEDAIARFKSVIEQLKPGMEVSIVEGENVYGPMHYTGIWDTLHTFYPKQKDIDIAQSRFYKRDMAGRPHLALPYTLLAEAVKFAEI